MRPFIPTILLVLHSYGAVCSRLPHHHQASVDSYQCIVQPGAVIDCFHLDAPSTIVVLAVHATDI
jgi:hypothetical protein